MNEREYVITTFRKNFINEESRIKDTVIYGLGKNTKTILETFPDYPIIGLLDGFETSGEIYGKRILSLDVLKGVVYRIIIIARTGAQKIIYNRISEYCENHDIEVFNLEGENLSEKNRTVLLENSYFELNKEDLQKEVDRHDNISFDIFDTLITRKVLYPENVFELISERIGSLNFDYVAERIKAEKRLSIHTIPNIYEIYEEIKRKTSADEYTVKMLIESEIETEKKLLIRREVMVELLNYAILQKKKVYLISDMYLTKEIIKNILTGLKIDGYADILVSCDYGVDKSNGLYYRYKEVVKEGSYLHIGDSEVGDGICAMSCDINCFLIKSPSDMLHISVGRSLIKHMQNKTGMLEMGMYASGIFNNPFSLYKSAGRLKINSTYDFGYLYVAPVITEFILWLIGRMQETHFDKILFISRDGYLIKALYDIAKKRLSDKNGGILPDSEYFLTSRRLCIASTIEDEESIRYAVALSFDGTPVELLEKRFFVKEEMKIDNELIYLDRTEYALTHKEAIYKKSKELRDNYLEYIKKLGIGIDERIAIFDFVSTGTCQMCIEKLLGMKLTGMYYTRIYEDYEPKINLDIINYTRDCENYFLLEYLIKAPEASLSYMDNSGAPIYSEEKRYSEQIADIKSMQQGVVDYFLDYMDLSSNGVTNDIGIAEQILKLADKKYMNLEDSSLFGCIMKDEFCNRYVELSL